MPVPGYPPVVLTEVYYMVWWAGISGQLGLTGCHYRVDLVAGTMRQDQLVEQLADDSEAAFCDMLSAEATYLGMTTRKVNLPAEVQIASPFHGTAGTRGITALPTQTCGLIRKRSATPGPGGRGRMYIPFPSEDDNNDAHNPDAAYITALGAFADTYINDVVVDLGGGNETTLRAVLFQPDPAAPVIKEIISWEVAGGWATQRGRGAFGPQGPNPWGTLL